MITVQHNPLDDRIHYKMGRALVEAGVKVSLVHACQGGVLIGMDGEQLNEEPHQSVMVDGMTLIPVSEPEGMISKAMKKIYQGDFYKTMVEMATRTKADLFVAHEPQSITVAKRAAEATGTKYLFDAHESLHFDNPKDNYAKQKWMSDLPYFIAANNITQAELADMNPGAKHEVIYNASLFESWPAKAHDEILLVHEGSFPFNRGLKLLMEALHILKNDEQQFKLKIIGEFSRHAEKEYFEESLIKSSLEDHVTVTGWQPYLEVGELLRGCSIGLILNTFTPNNLYGGPANKLFNYINAGLCVVSVDLPETRRIVEETGSGIIMEERSPACLAQNLSALLNNKDQLMIHRQAAEKAAPDLSWNSEKKKFISFVNRVIA
jgi:glycosyltransferase involved in cell wall biosynthesis